MTNYLSNFHLSSQKNLKELTLINKMCDPLKSIFNMIPKNDKLTDVQKLAVQMVDIPIRQCDLYAKAPLLSNKLVESFEKIMSCKDELNFDSYNSNEDFIRSIPDIIEKANDGSSCAKGLENYLLHEIPEYTSLFNEYNSLILEARKFCDENNDVYKVFNMFCDFVEMAPIVNT